MTSYRVYVTRVEMRLTPAFEALHPSIKCSSNVNMLFVTDYLSMGYFSKCLYQD